MALFLPGYRFNVWDDKGNGTCNTDFFKDKGKLGGESGFRTHAVRHHLRGGPRNRVNGFSRMRSRSAGRDRPVQPLRHLSVFLYNFMLL